MRAGGKLARCRGERLPCVTGARLRAEEVRSCQGVGHRDGCGRPADKRRTSADQRERDETAEESTTVGTGGVHGASRQVRHATQVSHALDRLVQPGQRSDGAGEVILPVRAGEDTRSLKVGLELQILVRLTAVVLLLGIVPAGRGFQAVSWFMLSVDPSEGSMSGCRRRRCTPASRCPSPNPRGAGRRPHSAPC
jgi:hypothetical protein